MGNLMVYHESQKATTIGTAKGEISKVSIVKVSRNQIQLNSRAIAFENVSHIKYEIGDTKFVVVHTIHDRSVSTTFRARSSEDCASWSKVCFRMWDDKKSEKRRLAQRAELEKKILEGRIDLLSVDHDLLHAAQDGDLKTLKALRRTTTDMNIVSYDTRKRTALHLATTRGFFDAVKIITMPMYERWTSSLAKLRAPKWTADYNEFVAFRRCTHTTFPCDCATRKCELLTNVGEFSDWYQYKYKYCAEIEEAYLKGQPIASISMSKGVFNFQLRNFNVRENLMDEKTQIPILEGSGKPTLMRRRQGADIDFRDEMGWTALHMALVRGHEKIALFLIEKGAFVNATNKVGYTVLHCASQRGRSNAIRALLTRGADVHAVNRTWSTPLHMAARRGHYACSVALCEAGADVSAMDADYASPMHFACWRNDKRLIQLLVRYGGTVSFA